MPSSRDVILVALSCLVLTCCLSGTANADTFTNAQLSYNYGYPLLLGATNVCVQSGVSQSSCSGSGAMGAFSGTAQAKASYGVLGASASETTSTVSVPGGTTLTAGAFSDAGFQDTFTISGGPNSGFLDFTFATSGTSSYSCTNTVSDGFTGCAGDGFARLFLTGTQLQNLANGQGTLTFEVPFSGSSVGVEAFLRSYAQCATFDPFNYAFVCNTAANYLDTAKVTGLSVLDSNGALVSGVTITSASGTDYNNISSGTTPVPEPSSLMMLGVGLLGLVGLSLKKSL